MSWTLQTADTAVTVEAGGRCPILTQIGGIGARNWAKRPTELPLPRRLAVGTIQYRADWTFDNADYQHRLDGQRLVLTYRAACADITLSSIWSAFTGLGPVQHEMILTNQSGMEMTVYSPDSLDLELASDGEPVQVFYISKDRFAPFSVGTQHHYGVYVEQLTDQYHADVWTSVDIDDTGFIPLVMLQADGCHGIYVGWEWNEGRIHVAGKAKLDGLYAGIAAGLPVDFCTSIPDGERFIVPSAFIGAFDGDWDDASNSLRKWLFAHKMPERNRSDPNIPYVQWNAFWNTGDPPGSWHCVESKYYPMIDSIAEVGIEEVTIDVGWWEKFGDFRGHSEKWPRGMAAASRYAHDHGMLFTLYFAFLNGGSEDPLALTHRGPNAHPEWFAQRWTLDFGVEESLDFTQKMLLQRLTEYDVDTFRSDLSPIVRRKAAGNRHSGCNDAAYWAQAGFGRLIDYLMERKPGLRFQNCNNGGSLKGYDLMRRSTAVQVTDTYNALDIRRAVWDSVYAFPLMQLLTQFGDVATSRSALGSPGYRFRTYLMGAPSAHFELPSEMPPEEAAVLKRLIAVYKRQVRPLVRDADVYHVLPRPDGQVWDGLELYDPVKGKGLLMVFRPDNDQPDIRVPLKKLDPHATYQISYDDETLEPQQASGRELMDEGLRVFLPDRYSAEWVFFERA